MNRTTLALDRHLFLRVKQEALRRHKTLKECLNEFLRLGLDTATRIQKPARRFRVSPRSLGKPLVNLADRATLERFHTRPL
jgi:hypothetical protein